MLWIVMLWSLGVSYWITLALSVPAALLVMRMFIFQHDCGHQSFFKSRRANDILGSVIGVLTLVPYHYWRRTHAIHHATSGNLDQRSFGDIDTLTVREYLGLSKLRRLLYRLYRHPFVMSSDPRISSSSSTVTRPTRPAPGSASGRASIGRTSGSWRC
jgi:omega-6 fatty acid desaturase (delta-12 desaturase)